MNTGTKKECLLEGLDCANCATKIENKVNTIEDVSQVSVDFVSRKMKIQFKDETNQREIMNEVERAIKTVEPDVVMVENEESNIDVMESIDKSMIIKLVIGGVFFLIGAIGQFSFWTELTIFLISYLFVGGDVAIKAIKNIIRGRVFDENFLMAIATIGAFALQEFTEGVAVMLFYQIGELFQDRAVNRSRKSIKALMDIKPDFANIIIENEMKKVSPDVVDVGDIIVVKPGEKVPLDGIVIEGKTTVDTTALTGESLPRDIEIGDEVLSGFINKNGVITVRVEKGFAESTVTKILELVQNASSNKAPTENFITKFAKYYTPAVVFTALALALIPPLLIPEATFYDWIYRALTFLVISCPCALVISIPLGFFGGIGGASKSGILIKGGNYLEALNNVDTVVFDKTGTLTKGIFKVTKISPSKESITKHELLEYAAYAESYSNHPIATSIKKAYNQDIADTLINNYDEISGYGIKVSVKGKEVLAGNKKLMEKENIPYDKIDTLNTIVYVAIDKRYVGYIIISDEIKEDSAIALAELKNVGIKKLVMLTGDNRSVGTKIGEALGIDEVYAELLPHQKVEKLEMLEEQKRPKSKIVFVGDGINDAPVLARADVGVAMGGLGSDAAIEAADVVLMTDEPSKLVTAIKIAKRTRVIVWQNIIFAFAVKGIVLMLGAGGLATIWEAVFADVGVALIAILNAMRVMKNK